MCTVKLMICLGAFTSILALPSSASTKSTYQIQFEKCTAVNGCFSVRMLTEDSTACVERCAKSAGSAIKTSKIAGGADNKRVVEQVEKVPSLLNANTKPKEIEE